MFLDKNADNLSFMIAWSIHCSRKYANFLFNILKK